MLMDEASLRPPIGDVLAVVGAVVTAHLNDGALTGPLPVTVGELVSVPAGDGRAVGIVHNLHKGRRVDDQGSRTRNHKLNRTRFPKTEHPGWRSKASESALQRAPLFHLIV